MWLLCLPFGCSHTMRSYVAALELRIEKLEKRLQFAKSRKASVALHDPDTSTFNPQMDRRDSLAAIRAAIHRKAARKRENSDVNSLVSDFGFLLVSRTPPPQQQTPDPSLDLSTQLQEILSLLLAI